MPEHEPTNASGADLAAHLRPFRRALTSGDQHAEIPREILSLRRDADGPQLAALLGRLLHDTFEGNQGVHRRGNAVHFRELERLAALAVDDPDCSLHVRDTLIYLALYGRIDRYFRDTSFRKREFLERVFSIWDFFTPDDADAVLERLRDSPAYDPSSLSTLVIEGLVLSPVDRPAAAGKFGRAREANDELWQELRIDVGASSYLTREQVERHHRANQREAESLRASLTFVDSMPTWSPGDHMYVCSCDPLYFRLYYPLWLSMSEYLRARRVSFHFLINGSAQVVQALLERADELRRSMGALRAFDSSSYADNVSFSTAPVPDHVPEVRSFYACSRFVFARQIAGQYQGPLVISDTDMFFRADPAQYLEALDLERIGVQSIRWFAMLKPWRRFTANTFVLPYSEPCHEAFVALEEYVIAGLPLARTWLLDQNAIDYLVQGMYVTGTTDLVTDLNRPGGPARPTASETIKMLMREQQRRAEMAPSDGAADE